MKFYNYLSINLISLTGFFCFLLHSITLFANNVFIEFEQKFNCEISLYIFKFCIILMFFVPILILFFFIEVALQEHGKKTFKILFQTKFADIIHKIFVYWNLFVTIIIFYLCLIFADLATTNFD